MKEILSRTTLLTPVQVVHLQDTSLPPWPGGRRDYRLLKPLVRDLPTPVRWGRGYEGRGRSRLPCPLLRGCWDYHSDSHACASYTLLAEKAVKRGAFNGWKRSGAIQQEAGSNGICSSVHLLIFSELCSSSKMRGQRPPTLHSQNWDKTQH